MSGLKCVKVQRDWEKAQRVEEWIEASVEVLSDWTEGAEEERTGKVLRGKQVPDGGLD
ncbi:UNVERIFIED_CONTAM: hypothetical protein Sradi_1151900 [Sesamum radiatum]|uniref:Uncharacterized protein n=1 Tax=Sesamum radiatum TaxID=300843 RepID=A0AAW2V9P8_SESRA